MAVGVKTDLGGQEALSPHLSLSSQGKMMEKELSYISGKGYVPEAHPEYGSSHSTNSA